MRRPCPGTLVAYLPPLAFGRIALSILALRHCPSMHAPFGSPSGLGSSQHSHVPKLQKQNAGQVSLRHRSVCCLLHLAWRQFHPDACHASWGARGNHVCASLVCVVWCLLHLDLKQLIDPDACHAHRGAERTPIQMGLSGCTGRWPGDPFLAELHDLHTCHAA